MEENGRVTVKKVERPDGMTEYSLEYIPPIMISDGNYLKEEHLNLAVWRGNHSEQGKSSFCQALAGLLICTDILHSDLPEILHFYSIGKKVVRKTHK